MKEKMKAKSSKKIFTCPHCHTVHTQGFFEKYEGEIECNYCFKVTEVE